MQTILIAVLSAILYTFIFYGKKMAEQEFDERKLVFTAIVGAVIGLVMWYYNLPITQLGVEQQLFAYAGMVALGESAFKGIYRWLKRKFGLW